jgi:hypothetical protein
VTLAVYNTLGQQVAVLQNGEQEAGYLEVRFDGNKPRGEFISTGIRQETLSRRENPSWK